MLKEKLRAEVLGGALRDAGNHMSGIYRGYYIVIELENGQYVVKINASSENDENNIRLSGFLQQQQTIMKQITGTQASPHFVKVMIRQSNLLKNVPAAINSCIEPVIQYLLNGGYASGCEGCGSTMESLNFYEVNGGHHYFCSSCAGEVNAALQQNQQQIRAQKSHLVPGLVGAFLGSLIGAALWVAIYKLGYIAGIAGAVTGICAMKGYEMLGKFLDKKGVVGSVIIMLLTIYLANRLAWSWEAYDALKDYGYTFADSYRELDMILSETNLTAGYYGDLVIGYILTLLCSFRNIISAFRASGGSYSIRKVN